jgi:hypothetical protein
VTVADLDKGKLTFGSMFRYVRREAQAIGTEHSAFHDAKRARTRPGHALQEAAAVDAIMVVVVQDLVRDFDLAGFAMFLVHWVKPPRCVIIANHSTGFLFPSWVIVTRLPSAALELEHFLRVSGNKIALRWLGEIEA